MSTCLTRLAGVEIDLCVPHGAWFDRHELERVSQAVSSLTGQPVPQAPPGWVHAQPPAGPGVVAAPGMVAPAGGAAGPGLWAGAAVVGVAAAGAAAYATLGGEPQDPSRSSFGPVDALSVAPDAVSTGYAVTEAAGGTGEVAHAGVAMVGDAAGGAADVAGDAAEAAGSILGSIFDAIGSIFS